MGFTHYWYRNRDLTTTEWSAFLAGFERMLALPGIPPLSKNESFPTPPEMTDERVFFNGVGEDGHETFVFARKNDEHPEWRKPDVDGWIFDFCKTAHKPYDLVVTACLAYFDSVLGDGVKVSSDGEDYEWQAGLKLAREAWPDVEINLPRGVVDPEWESADEEEDASPLFTVEE